MKYVKTENSSMSFINMKITQFHLYNRLHTPNMYFLYRRIAVRESYHCFLIVLIQEIIPSMFCTKAIIYVGINFYSTLEIKFVWIKLHELIKVSVFPSTNQIAMSVGIAFKNWWLCICWCQVRTVYQTS